MNRASFRKRLVIAMSGGGVRGVASARFLARLEEALGVPLPTVVDLWVGTSAGAILAAGGACGVPAARMLDLFTAAAPAVFRRGWRSYLWPVASRALYTTDALRQTLVAEIGERRLGEVGPGRLVVTTWDAVQGAGRYYKSDAAHEARLAVVDVALLSATVPGFFPVGAAGEVDGGLGGVNNPAFVAAVEAVSVLGWAAEDVTILSVGTGVAPSAVPMGRANRLWPWQWIGPGLGAMMTGASAQQCRSVQMAFPAVEFIHVDVPLRSGIAFNDWRAIPDLVAYGDQMWAALLDN